MGRITPAPSLTVTRLLPKGEDEWSVFSGVSRTAGSSSSANQSWFANRQQRPPHCLRYVVSSSKWKPTTTFSRTALQPPNCGTLSYHCTSCWVGKPLVPLTSAQLD